MDLLFAAALLATSGAGQDPLCDEIVMLSTGAREAPPFETLHRSGYQLKLLPGGYCRLNSQRNWSCAKNLLPPEMNQTSIAQRIAACLPDMKLTTGKPDHGNRSGTVSGNGLVFELDESGSDRGHVGRMLLISIRAEP